MTVMSLGMTRQNQMNLTMQSQIKMMMQSRVIERRNPLSQILRQVAVMMIRHNTPELLQTKDPTTINKFN